MWGKHGLPLPDRSSLAPAGYVPAGGVPLVVVVGLLLVPGVVIKQLVNVVQLKTAMAQMVRYDQQAQQAQQQQQGRRGAAKQ